MEILDKVIINAYVSFDTPADRIVADPKLAGEFHAAVSQHLGDDCIELADLNKKLLNMRRRGEDKGGLPRLRREYRGRGSKPR